MKKPITPKESAETAKKKPGGRDQISPPRKGGGNTNPKNNLRIQKGRSGMK